MKALIDFWSQIQEAHLATQHSEEDQIIKSVNFWLNTD